MSVCETLDIEEEVKFAEKNFHTTSFIIDNEMCVEIPSKPKKEWIKANCRKAEDDPVGYRPDLYRTWMAGRREEYMNFAEEDNFSIPEYLLPKIATKKIGSKAPDYLQSDKSSKKMDYKRSRMISFIRRPEVEKWKQTTASFTLRKNGSTIKSNSKKFIESVSP